MLSVRTCLLFAADPEQVRGVARDLDLVGVTCELHPLDATPGETRPDLACVWAGEDAPAALAFCQLIRREEWMKGVPLLVMVRVEHLRELFLREGTFDDFVVAPAQLPELDARVRHLLWRAKQGEQSDVLTFGPLVINLATYQVTVNAKVVDLTYMEYELLKFLATHRGRVHTRQSLLSRVWGYDYFGGSRTVDVHVRRLRAKLGEHANVIQTVRNVGYKFVV